MSLRIIIFLSKTRLEWWCLVRISLCGQGTWREKWGEFFCSRIGLDCQNMTTSSTSWAEAEGHCQYALLYQHWATNSATFVCQFSTANLDMTNFIYNMLHSFYMYDYWFNKSVAKCWTVIRKCMSLIWCDYWCTYNDKSSASYWGAKRHIIKTASCALAQ